MLIIIIVNLFVITFGIIYCGLGPGDILDIPSIIFVYIPSFVAPFAIYNWAKYKSAFSAAFTTKEMSIEEKENIVGFFSLMGKVAVGFGWIGFLIGHVAMLKNVTAAIKLEDYATGFAASLITVVYGYIFKYGFCEIAEKRITSKS